MLLLRQETQYAYSLRESSPFGSLQTADVFPCRNNRMLSQAIHFADIVKSRRARGDAKAGGPSLAARPNRRASSQLVPLGLCSHWLWVHLMPPFPPPPPPSRFNDSLIFRKYILKCCAKRQPPNTLLARNSAGEGCGSCQFYLNDVKCPNTDVHCRDRINTQD